MAKKNKITGEQKVILSYGRAVDRFLSGFVEMNGRHPTSEDYRQYDHQIAVYYIEELLKINEGGQDVGRPL